MNAPRSRLDPLALLVLALLGTAAALGLVWRGARLDPTQVSSLQCRVFLGVQSWRLEVEPHEQSARCQLIPIGLGRLGRRSTIPLAVSRPIEAK